jgi:hypothetical protein
LNGDCASLWRNLEEKPMRIVHFVALALMLAAIGAQADTREYEKGQLARFERYAGPPIEEVPMFQMWQWQVVGPQQLVVWSTIHDAYLVHVDKGCNRLQWTHGLSLTQEMRQKVTRKFDYVAFGDQRCKITSIRPIDYRTMVKEGAAQPPAQRDHKG